MRRLVNVVGVLTFSLLLMSCSKTVGSHTIDERERLAKLHSQISFEFMFNNNLSVAQGEAEEALRLDPRGVESNHAMARVQQLLNDNYKIVEYYERALKTDPYAVVVLNDYGQYLCGQGQPEVALSKFDRAGSQLMSPQRMVSYTRAAACSINNGQYDLAQQYLIRALELKPDSKPVLLNLARVNVKNNQFPKANNYLGQYLKIESKPTQEALKLAEHIRSNL